MNSIEMYSNAKINLSIDIFGKREDGYHEVAMILHEVDLSDIIHIEKRNRKIEVSCSTPHLPTDDRNIAYKAAQVFFRHTGIDEGTGITITKRIPISAGLGGGSSNAAHVLIGLNELYETGLTKDQLEFLASKLGSDVPFFIQGGTAICTGRGEIVEKIDTDTVFDILIISPEIAVSTKEVYDAYKDESNDKRPLTENLIDALKSNDSITVAKNLINVLEGVTLKMYPEIREIKTKLLEMGAINSLMSGSGSAVFGIFKSRYDAVIAADRNTESKYQKFVVRTRVR